jgi:hypothetical protein
MQQAQRSKLCKLQNKPGGEIIYIVYQNLTQDSKSIRYGIINDFAGIFYTKEDADQVAECLNNIFSKLHDEKWELTKPYASRRTNVTSSDTPFWIVESSFKQKIQGPFKAQKILIKTTSKQLATNTLIKSKRGTRNSVPVFTESNGRLIRVEPVDYRIVQYRINDILPTMYLDDYNKTLHLKKFKHVINELKDFPQAQANRQQLRRAARENLFQYSDSSDSEDDTKYKRVTKRSLLHTPTRPKKFTKKLGVK